MLKQTKYTVPKELIARANIAIPNIDFRLTINKPTSDFFYDPWVIRDEFKGTVWDSILNTLPEIVGEARLIVLEPGKAYQSHSDIDDRFHLNIAGDNRSYLINLDNLNMHSTKLDYIWYDLDASPKHSAVNFGELDRIQLVVRKLLQRNTLVNPVRIKISGDRFEFDDRISKLLNHLNKKGYISDFNIRGESVYVSIESAIYYSTLALEKFNRVKVEII
jgi:hypothetical protein